ncbi:MAG: bifunctional (p)ppGpp synthetase/guanosine-3',5'-bis(diphosphate) 3'-pyrophosphohydrolase [Alphaproteobacteria bacterium]|jgi:GTP pyrophosphokinase|nr:bifunctional (p)ppGpp synthetase/guanosine-3',5'-bis(diphosphate) 3'-pyrophosphohydrolase [Alphaproteobacteria bacterium]MDP7190876.1 bifunctional (p)ppGpp synthetase/guanosine-3',5'-bis(diphosphate) 3'-pyrophosphohydrolase [Alphaproteobacteria bacterium]HJO88913.1 bifunctional (p)ppGpp synthetase/guanosine-3',5'-bis(diphosphate) 3'-pyrophosphohydrolase [Alphaproteobacteria bacterium]
MLRQFELVERVRTYDPSVDEDAINRAYVFAMKAHGTQLRASGDPYFSHPIEVAGILADMKMDGASIVTALLHDVVEDTTYSQDDIKKIFGNEIARLVDGVTKLTQIKLQSDHTQQAENFRKLVLAMSDDIRVLLVKLADRLHNMRTLSHIKNLEKRLHIANETMDIFAPLAERMGMHEIRDELYDLAFKEINPDARESILSRLSFLRVEGAGLVKKIIRELGKTLKAAGLETRITGREKTPHSIWLKMRSKAVEMEQLSDIIAFRVVMTSVDQCYQALGILHGSYPVVPGTFKDYISTPKPNDYRSLHTTMIGPKKQRIEVQIRTKEMNEVAEFGVAAHWSYKQNIPGREGRQYRWLRELLDILENASGPEEFLEHTKLEMFHNQVFCFTPKGELIALPRGATSLDFAYMVHTEVGNTCAGARINGVMMPLKTELANGDQVEIVRSKKPNLSADWENIVITGKAQSCIRRFIHSRERQEFLDLGRNILKKAFDKEDLPCTKRALGKVLNHFNYGTVEDLYIAVGHGDHTAKEVIRNLYPDHQILADDEGKVIALTKAIGRRMRRKKKGFAVPIKGLTPGMAVHFGGCCYPIPGDRIVGIVTSGKGVAIHTIDCETLEKLDEESERWLDVTWDEGRAAEKSHVGRIHVVLANEAGSLGNLSTTIGKNMSNITNLKITNRSSDFFEMIVDLEVKDVKHLANIVAALRATTAINSVERARG